MQEGDKIFELRLNDFVGPLALVCNRVIANIALTVNLKCQRVAGRALEELNRVKFESNNLTFLRPISRGYCATWHSGNEPPSPS